MAQASQQYPSTWEGLASGFLFYLSMGRLLLAAAAFLPNLAIPSLFLTMASPRLLAEASAKPVLHRRAEAGSIEARDFSTISRGTTTLPLDASGAYSLGEAGEFVEVDLEPDRLSGYISRLGDAVSDTGTPLTFFFDTGWLNGREIGFTTRRVHGIWFSFVGTIVRGNVESRFQDGYYRLQGSMVLHDAAKGAAQARDVSLPLRGEYSSQ